MIAPALRLLSVDKIYRPRKKPQVHAVRGMSLDVRPGEIMALLGSSGCGKTSVLRMIAGFEEVSCGTIAIKDREIHKLPPARRGVAMAFEGYSLYPPLTIRENISFALRSAAMADEDIERKVAAMAHLLEIGPILDRYPSSVSGGQQQRASLGRALVRSADLYLLDEPMGQLEPQLRAVLRGRLKHFLKEHDMTTILVTHDQTEANALADRIAVMENGVLQQLASSAELKDRPANLFVGTFIGEPPMNVIQAEARREDGRITFALPGGLTLIYGENEIPREVSDTAIARSRVTIGIRPHAIRLAQEGLPARVVSNQWLGDQTHIAAELADRTIVAVEHHRVHAAVGSDIRLRINAADLHIFDSDSGTAIAHGSELANGALS